MTSNTRKSKLSSGKQEQYVFTWKAVNGWDYNIGEGETAASLAMANAIKLKVGNRLTKWIFELFEGSLNGIQEKVQAEIDFPKIICPPSGQLGHFLDDVPLDGGHLQSWTNHRKGHIHQTGPSFIKCFDDSSNIILLDKSSNPFQIDI